MWARRKRSARAVALELGMVQAQQHATNAMRHARSRGRSTARLRDGGVGAHLGIGERRYLGVSCALVGERRSTHRGRISIGEIAESLIRL